MGLDSPGVKKRRGLRGLRGQEKCMVREVSNRTDKGGIGVHANLSVETFGKGESGPFEWCRKESLKRCDEVGRMMRLLDRQGADG